MFEDTVNTFLGLIVFVIGISTIIVTPLLVIWALNTVFNAGIPYAFFTWLGMFIILTVLGVFSFNVNLMRKNR